MAQSLLQRQYLALISRWPADPLRPNISFADTLSYRVSSYFGQTSPADTSIPSQNQPSINEKVGQALQMRKFDERKVEREMNAVAALLEDRFKNAYPLSERITKPQTNPEYYTKLMAELEQAPERGFWSRNLNKWKGYVRMN